MRNARHLEDNQYEMMNSTLRCNVETYSEATDYNRDLSQRKELDLSISKIRKPRIDCSNMDLLLNKIKIQREESKRAAMLKGRRWIDYCREAGKAK